VSSGVDHVNVLRWLAAAQDDAARRTALNEAATALEAAQARIAELEGELRQILVDATEQHADWCNLPPVDDEARDYAFSVILYARNALTNGELK